MSMYTLIWDQLKLQADMCHIVNLTFIFWFKHFKATLQILIGTTVKAIIFIRCVLIMNELHDNGFQYIIGCRWRLKLRKCWIHVFFFVLLPDLISKRDAYYAGVFVIKVVVAYRPPFVLVGDFYHTSEVIYSNLSLWFCKI